MKRGTVRASRRYCSPEPAREQRGVPQSRAHPAALAPPAPLPRAPRALPPHACWHSSPHVSGVLLQGEGTWAPRCTAGHATPPGMLLTCGTAGTRCPWRRSWACSCRTACPACLSLGRGHMSGLRWAQGVAPRGLGDRTHRAAGPASPGRAGTCCRRIRCSARSGSCGSGQACSHRRRCWWPSSCSARSGKLQVWG